MSGDGDIAAMTLQLGRDPSSLVFLALGEALRRKGDLASALPVAESGVAWYPEMTGAWDLLARVRSDRNEGDLAFDAWTTVLRLDPEHAGAHKGLAFLAFRAGEFDRSLRHLLKARQLAPADPSVPPVLDRVAKAASQRGPAPAPASPLSEAGVSGHAILVDLKGQPLDGRLETAAGLANPAVVGAALAGLSRDAERTCRLLGLGPWRRISLGGGPVSLEIRSPTIDSLLVMADQGGRPESSGAEADRLSSTLRQWLEALR